MSKKIRNRFTAQEKVAILRLHLLVNMLEAYYFAHAAAINGALETELIDFEVDVETIRHPKNKLKRLSPGFDEVEHGRLILEQLDVIHVLSNPSTCRSLRTLFGWCSKAIGREFTDVYDFTDVYELRNGSYFEVTRPQIDALPAPRSVSHSFVERQSGRLLDRARPFPPANGSAPPSRDWPTFADARRASMALA